jgi:hypothetical protein
VKKIDTGLGGDFEFLKSAIMGVLPARLYVASRLRNAWHGSTSHQTKGDSSLQDTFLNASAVAAGWRASGSHFLIREVPGVAILTERGIACAADFWEERSFADWDLAAGRQYLKVGSPVGDLLQSLDESGDWRRRPSKWSTLQSWSRRGSITRAGDRTSFDVWKSYPADYRAYGETYRDLGWERIDPYGYDATGVARIRRAFAAVNGAGTNASAIARATASGQLVR